MYVSHRYMVYDAPDWGTLGPSNSTHIQQHICSKSNTPSICVIASIRDPEPLNSHSRQLCQNKSTKELTSAVAPSPHYQSRDPHAFLSTIMHNCKLSLDAGAVEVGAAPTCTQPNRRPRWPVIADEAGCGCNEDRLHRMTNLPNRFTLSLQQHSTQPTTAICCLTKGALN